MQLVSLHLTCAARILSFTLASSTLSVCGMSVDDQWIFVHARRVGLGLTSYPELK